MRGLVVSFLILVVMWVVALVIVFMVILPRWEEKRSKTPTPVLRGATVLCQVCGDTSKDFCCDDCGRAICLNCESDESHGGEFICLDCEREREKTWRAKRAAKTEARRARAKAREMIRSGAPPNEVNRIFWRGGVDIREGLDMPVEDLQRHLPKSSAWE